MVYLGNWKDVERIGGFKELNFSGFKEEDVYKRFLIFYECFWCCLGSIFYCVGWVDNYFGYVKSCLVYIVKFFLKWIFLLLMFL